MGQALEGSYAPVPSGGVMTRDLAPSEWKEFLEDFSRTHRAWLATIDTVSYGRPARVRIIQRRLRSLVPDMCGDRVMGLEIRFQEKSPFESAVQITAPVTVRVTKHRKETHAGSRSSTRLAAGRGFDSRPYRAAMSSMGWPRESVTVTAPTRR